MSVPLKDIVSQHDNAYNFYVVQPRITTERAFGVFFHRWAILHQPLTCPLSKMGPLVTCLCRLHNYYINAKDRDVLRSSHKDAAVVAQYMDTLHNRVDNCIRSDETLI